MIEVDDRVAVLEKYAKKDFNIVGFNSVFEFFTKTYPKLKNDWLLVGTGESDTHVTIFLFFKSDRAVRQFSELAFSILGGSFISKLLTRFIESNDLNSLAKELRPLGYKKFAEVSIQKNMNALTRLERLCDVVLKIESPGVGIASKQRNALQKFRIAISNGNFSEAEQNLSEIEAGGYLDSMNICFLKYQLWFYQNKFTEIWEDKNISEVLRSRRPRVVSEFLLKSLWQLIASKMDSGDIDKISDVDLGRMSQLLKVIGSPITEEGRICLAVVVAVSSNLDKSLNLEIEISDDERLLLEEIIRTKAIPSHLLRIGANLEIDQASLGLEISRESILQESEKLRESGDVRGLMKVLIFAQNENAHVEDVVKKLAQCISDEKTPEFAHIFLTHIQGISIDTSNWGRRSKTAFDEVEKMANIYRSGWLGLLEMKSRDMIVNESIICDAAENWSLSYFIEVENDEKFASWLNDCVHISDGRFLAMLFERLRNLDGGNLSRNFVTKIFDQELNQIRVVPKESEMDSLLNLIKKGESESLEFKSTLRVPLQGGGGPEMFNSLEFACVKSVAALLNTKNGGNLLIGVGDSGEIIGVNRDYESSKKIADRDGFQLHFRQLLRSQINELSPNEVSISFFEINNKDIVKVGCPPATKMRYVNRNSQKVLFVRDGNATRELRIEELLDFVKTRWPNHS